MWSKWLEKAIDNSGWLTSNGLKTGMLNRDIKLFNLKVFLFRYIFTCEVKILDIAYSSKKLKSYCTNATAAERKYGPEMAEKIQQRIDEISAARSVEEMLQYRIGRCHRLKGDRRGQYSVDLVHPYRLVFVIKIIDNVQVAQIAIIKEIVDYH